MTDWQWYDFMRLFSICAYFASAFMILKLARPYLAEYTSRGKDLLWILLALMFLVGSGSITQIALNADWRWESFAAFIIALVSTRAAFRKRKDPTRPFNRSSTFVKE